MLRSLRSISTHPPSLTISLVFGVNSVLMGNWLVRIPEIQTRLALSEGELGLCLLAMPAGAVSIMPMMGWVAARWGAGRVTLLAALFFCLVTVLPTLAWSMAFLIAALFLVGFMSGAMDIAMNAEAAAIEAARNVPILSTCHGFWSLGAMIGAAMGGAAAALAVPFPLHILAVASGLILLLLLRRRTLIDAGGGGTATGPAFALPNKPLLGLAVIAFCILVNEGAIADWSAVYMTHSLGAGPGLAAFGYAAFSGTMALGRFYGDQIAAHVTAAAIVRTSGLLAAAGMGLALGIGHPVAAIAGFALTGLGFATVVPITYRAAVRTPGMVPGTSIAAVATAGYAGLFVGPPLIGFTAEAIELSGALALVVLLSLVIALLAPYTLRPTVRPRPPRIAGDAGKAAPYHP